MIIWLREVLAQVGAPGADGHSSLAANRIPELRALAVSRLPKRGLPANSGTKNLHRISQVVYLFHQPPFMGREVEMLSKCANPSCSTPLLYLREGKIFMMEHAPAPEPVRTTGPGKKIPAQRVEHFWLCGPCSAEMTLVYDSKAGVRVLPKSDKKLRMRAAS